MNREEPWGADAARWASEFRQTAINLGYSDMDADWLFGWFANAIEMGRVVHPDTKREGAPQAERRAAYLRFIRALPIIPHNQGDD